jgi:hypothetical protein
MKLSEVRPFVDRVCADLAPVRGELHDWHKSPDDVRRALAEAFIAGVRSQGLRYVKDTKLWAECGCVPAEESET